MPGMQGVVSPAEHQTEVAPVIVSATHFGGDLMEFGFSQIFKWQTGDGTSVVLPPQKI